MKNSISSLSIVGFMLFSVLSYAQEHLPNTFNLDFEETIQKYPTKWKHFEEDTYQLSLDSVNKVSGKYAVFIESDSDDVNEGTWSLTIPNTYEAKKITLSAYVKTENVIGTAGFSLSKDLNRLYYNSEINNINGTTQWKKYEISLSPPYPISQIMIRAYLRGKGKVWFDHFELKIDDRPIEECTPIVRNFKALNDTAFKNGSGIAHIQLNEAKIINLKLLGLIWGFLKYHHPSIMDGNYNWDYELFRILPLLLNVKNNQERDTILSNWILKLGDFKEEEKNTSSHSIKMLPDLNWIQEVPISTELRHLLNKVARAKRSDNNYYVSIQNNPYQALNAFFDNEDLYEDMDFPDAGIRLVALYRYWNMVQYFFPYRYLINDWNHALEKFIPLFLEAKDRLAYELAFQQIIAAIQDTHANLWWGSAYKINSAMGSYFPLVHLRFIDKKAVVSDYYDHTLKPKVGLEIGDIITEVNGLKVDDWVRENARYYPASNQVVQLRDMAIDLLRSTQKQINIRYISKGIEREKTIPLYSKNQIKSYKWFKPDTNNCYRFIDKNIGYISLATIQKTDSQKIREAFKNTKGIIIDIRNYPSYPVMYSLGSFLVAKNKPFVKLSNGHVRSPGLFTYDKPKILRSSGKTYKGKIVVLVNEFTQSQAEFTTMAFKASDHTKVIGSTTAGADGNLSTIPLPGRLYTSFSGMGVYYPDGTETQKIGIVPDIEVKPSIQGIKEGRDEVLEKAIEYINQIH